MGALSVLGLDDATEQVFEALVVRSGAAVDDLVRDTGLSRKAVTAALQALEGRGLATSTGTGRFAAVPVEPALDALVRAQEQDLARVRAHAQVLAAQARHAAERQRPEDLVAVAVGQDVIQAHFTLLQKQATDEVLTLDRPPYPTSGGAAPNPDTASTMAGGVTYRTIYDRSLLDDAAIFTRIQGELAAGEQGRVLADLPLKLAIADRSMAILPLDGQDPSEQAVLVVRPSVLLDSLAALFDALWSRAVVLHLGARPHLGVDPELQQVVQYLAAGLTDERIARHLGTSERTVRRKVAAALDALGAETRFQAGIKAHQLRWLPDL